jgi:para-aminobenzoate synthetase component 1
LKSPAPSPAARPLRLDLAPFEAAKMCAHLPGLVFFDSALEEPDAISIIAACPREIVRGSSAADWDSLREKVRASRCATTVDDGIPHGMAAGFVEYDGAFRFGFYDDLLVYRHADESWCEIGDFSSKLRPAQNLTRAPARLDFQPTISRAHFCEMVARAQRYIAAGDIYQVNLSQQFISPWSSERGDALRFYEALRIYSPAPHAAFLRSPQRAILSCSPESFLHLSGSRIQTRPIKGTRPRRADPGADEKSAFDLLTSQKEIAELVMITDLARNDLGQICKFGSVKVRELLKLERFEQVFHLVSTVEGQLRSDVDHVSALRACFPGGSITGAPKKRAREIIAELEPARRGLYTGAIGFFGFNGESRFNIAIRTALLENGVAHFHVGAGIVADSIPQMEYEETLHKAAGILLAAGKAEG